MNPIPIDAAHGLLTTATTIGPAQLFGFMDGTLYVVYDGAVVAVASLGGPISQTMMCSTACVFTNHAEPLILLGLINDILGAGSDISAFIHPWKEVREIPMPINSVLQLGRNLWIAPSEPGRLMQFRTNALMQVGKRSKPLLDLTYDPEMYAEILSVYCSDRRHVPFRKDEVYVQLRSSDPAVTKGGVFHVNGQTGALKRVVSDCQVFTFGSDGSFALINHWTGKLTINRPNSATRQVQLPEHDNVFPFPNAQFVRRTLFVFYPNGIEYEWKLCTLKRVITVSKLYPDADFSLQVITAASVRGNMFAVVTEGVIHRFRGGEKLMQFLRECPLVTLTITK